MSWFKRKKKVEKDTEFHERCFRAAGYSEEEISKFDFEIMSNAMASKLIMDRIYERKKKVLK